LKAAAKSPHRQSLVWPMSLAVARTQPAALVVQQLERRPTPQARADVQAPATGSVHSRQAASAAVPDGRLAQRAPAAWRRQVHALP
jgi:hypothetical protein